MQFTLYSLAMAVLCSSIFILIISALHKNYYFMDISSVYGIVLLYLFCGLRMFIPVEFTWARVIRMPDFFNKLYRLFTRELFIIGSCHICIYHFLCAIWIARAIKILAELIYIYFDYNNSIKNLSVNTKSPDIKTARKIIEKIYNKRVEIVVSPDIDEPVSFGIIHRKILIPDYTYSEKDLYYILSHECAHLKNHDLLVQVLVNILCAVYWWNPSVYSLRNGLEKSFELRCDHIVIKNLNNNETAAYLETILKVFRNQNGLLFDRHNKVRLLGTEEDNMQEIKERFTLISRMKAKKTRPFGKWAVTGIMICLIVLSYSFILQTAFQPSAEQIETEALIYELTASNGYIVKYANGTYVLKSERGDVIIIDKETAGKLVYESGLKITEEESNYEKD